MATRWVHPRHIAIWSRDGWPHGGPIRHTLQPSTKGGWPYGGHIPDSLQNNSQGWMAIRWAHPRSPAKQFTRFGGHTVGTSQLLCTFETIIDHTVGQCPGMVSDVISKTTAQDNSACDCRQGWIATRWAHPRMWVKGQEPTHPWNKDTDAMHWSRPGPCRSPLIGQASLCADTIGPRGFGQPSQRDKGRWYKPNP